MSKIHWIHISDLHLNMVGTQTSTLRDDLPSYIQNIAKKEKTQYIFITGDLRFAKKNKFSDNTTCYFEKLRSAAGIDKQSQFFVVGNHDVDRKNRTRLKAITEVEETYFENDSVISSNLIKGLKAGRTGLLNQLRGILTEEQYALHANPKILHFLVKTNDLNIVHVDSTVTYSDKRKNDFIIGSYALREVLQSCDKDKPTIILSHYPPSSLEPNEEKAVLKILKAIKFNFGLLDINIRKLYIKIWIMFMLCIVEIKHLRRKLLLALWKDTLTERVEEDTLEFINGMKVLGGLYIKHCRMMIHV